VSGLRLIGLSKTYSSYPCGIKSNTDVRALNKAYMEVNDGELLGILGHNGAGKTTLLSVLTGQIAAT
jgi:ABC-type multidrug transport system ATPase subunit